MTSFFHPSLAVNERVQIAAIRRFPGVLGLGFGSKRTGGTWRQGPYVTFYVRSKHPENHIQPLRLAKIPAKIGRFETDVLPVGHVLGCSLRHDDKFSTAHTTAHAAALVRAADGSTRALMSGHVALPRPASGWVFTWPPTSAAKAHVLATDDATGAAFQGDVIGGEFGDNQGLDWAVVGFTDPVPLDGVNATTGKKPPFSVAKVDPKDTYRFRSPVQSSPFKELICQGVLSEASVTMDVSHAGHSTPYSNLVSLRMTKHHVVPGDSGQLVFDQKGRALGMIVGYFESGNDHFALVAPASALQSTARFAPFFPSFFSEA